MIHRIQYGVLKLQRAYVMLSVVFTQKRQEDLLQKVYEHYSKHILIYSTVGIVVKCCISTCRFSCVTNYWLQKII